MTMKPKVLIVDDEPEILELIKLRLESRNYECVTADSVEKALEWVKTYSFSMVLMDVSLPGMSGLEGLKALKSAYPRLPIVMVTGLADEGLAREAMLLGACEYVTKPIDFDYLINIITLQQLK